MSRKTVYVPVDSEAYGCGLLLGFLWKYWPYILGSVFVIFLCGGAYALVNSGYDYIYNHFNLGGFGKCPPGAGCVLELKDQRDIKTLLFSPDGRWMASSSYLDPVMVREVQSNYALKFTLERAGDIVFSPDSRMLIGTCGSEIKLWDMDSGQLLRQFDVSGSVDCLAVSPDGQLLAVGGKDQFLEVWDLSTGTLRHKLEGHFDNPYWDDVGYLAFSPGGTLVVVNNGVQLWDAASGTYLETFDPGTGLPQKTSMSIYQVAFSSDGSWMAVGGQLSVSGGYDAGGLIQIWDLNQKKLVKQINDPAHISSVWNVSFTHGDRWLLWVDTQQTATLWDIAAGSIVQQVNTGTEAGSSLWAAAVTPDGQQLVTGDEEIRFWKISP